MGNIGPSRQLYDVLPAPAFGVEDADLWRLDTKPTRMTRSETIDKRAAGDQQPSTR